MTESDTTRPRRALVATGAIVAALSVTIASCTVDVRFGTDRAGAETTAPTSTVPAPVASPQETGVRHLLAAEIAQAPLILDEDFSGPGLDTSVWNTCHWWDNGGCTIASNDELEWYLPSQVAVRDGALELTAERRDVVGEDGEVFPYTSGMVTTGPPVHDGVAKLAFTYGAVEVEFRAPLGAGLWPAIWMLPASEQSKPEIDMFEAVGQRPDEVSMFFHPKIDPDRNVSGTRFRLPEGQTLADPHVVRLEWSPGLMDFYFNGEKVWQVTGAQVPDEPMYLVMNLAVGGVFGGTPDPAAFPATFFIDHVRIWSGGTQ